jgi:hypothetical protein
VPAQQNPERLHYLELACRRSDLIVVDEAVAPPPPWPGT